MMPVPSKSLSGLAWPIIAAGGNTPKSYLSWRRLHFIFLNEDHGFGICPSRSPPRQSRKAPRH